MYKTIGADDQSTLEVSTNIADGTTPVYAAPITIRLLNKGYDVDVQGRDADVSALGDIEETFRFKRRGATVTLRLLIPSSGPQFKNAVGYYARFNEQVSALATSEPYEGILLGAKVEVVDDANIETVTIKCGADHDD